MTDQTHANPPPEPLGNAIQLTEHTWVRGADITFAFARSSGPGGQSVNKLNTRAQLRVAIEAVRGLDDPARLRLRRLAGQRLTNADELLISSDRHRSQLDNRRDCVQRLAELVEQAQHVPKTRRKSRPTRAMIERRLEAKKRRSARKQSRRWRPES